MKCLICNSGALSESHLLYDDRYGYPGKFVLTRCLECSHASLQHDFTLEELTSLYSNYYPRTNFDLENYQPHLEKAGFSAWLEGSGSSAFRWVPRNVRILDVGCGFGETLGYHTARGCDAYGVEVDENIRRVAKKYGFNMYVGLFNSDIYETDFFDYVTMDQVLEHVTDPLATLQGVARILKPGGKAVISFPNASGWGARVFGYRWINWHIPYHLHFYSNNSLKILAKKAGLKIVDDRTSTPSAWLHFQLIHLCNYPTPGNTSKFWAGSACGKQVNFTTTQKVVMRLLKFIYRAKVNHLITRVFDGFGIGDNRIVFLVKP